MVRSPVMLLPSIFLKLSYARTDKGAHRLCDSSLRPTYGYQAHKVIIIRTNTSHTLKTRSHCPNGIDSQYKMCDHIYIYVLINLNRIYVTITRYDRQWKNINSSSPAHFSTNFATRVQQRTLSNSITCPLAINLGARELFNFKKNEQT